MIRLSSEIGVHQFVAFRAVGIASGRLQSHKYRINLAQDLRIRVFENPALLGLVIGEEDPQVSSALVGSLFLAPNSKLIAGFLELRVGHVIGVKKQRFAFGEENSAEDGASLALWISIEDVNNMKVARGHKVSNVAPRAQHLSFAGQRTGFFGKLIGELMNFYLIFNERSLIAAEIQSCRFVGTPDVRK